MKNEYFRIKSSDNHNNLILELISDVDLYQINSVLNHQYISTDGSLPETIYFKVRYIGYQEKPDILLLHKVLPFTAVTKSRIKDFVMLPMEKVTHLPSDIGIWVDYTEHKLRYKMQYNIKLHDGTIIRDCYPNGNTFTSWHGKEFHDDEIKEIQLCDEFESELMQNSLRRISDNYKTFRYFLLNEKPN